MIFLLNAHIVPTPPTLSEHAHEHKACETPDFSLCMRYNKIRLDMRYAMSIGTIVRVPGRF